LKTNILQKDDPNVSRRCTCMCLWCQQCQFKLKTNTLQKDDRRIGPRDCQYVLHFRASKRSLLFPFPYSPIATHNAHHVKNMYSNLVLSVCLACAIASPSPPPPSSGEQPPPPPPVIGRAATLLAFVFYATICQRCLAASSVRRAQLSAASCKRASPDA
jgi:hypothetical protein